MQRNAPLPISNTGSLHVFPLVVCSSLEPPDTSPLPSSETDVRIITGNTSVHAARVVRSIMDTRIEDSKCTERSFLECTSLYRCHRSTPGVVSRVQLEIPSVAPLPQIKTEECKCACARPFFLPSSLFFSSFFHPIVMHPCTRKIIMIRMTGRRAFTDTRKSKYNESLWPGFSIRTCPDPTFH